MGSRDGDASDARARSARRSRRDASGQLSHREHTRHFPPDPFLAEVWIIRIVEEPSLQRLHELAVDYPWRDISLGGQFTERPGDAGGAEGVTRERAHGRAAEARG